MKYEVSLKDLRQAGACYSGYNKLVRALQGIPFTDEDDERESYIHHAHKEPVPIIYILETNGLDDALWALRCVPEVDRDARLFIVWCARQVQHLMKDQRSCDALDVAESLSPGEAAAETLVAAWNAARATAMSTLAAAAMSTFAEAARSTLAESAWAAAGTAAWDATRASQEEMLKRMCQGKAEWQTSPKWPSTATSSRN